MISYEVAPERGDYIQRDEVKLVVRIVNDSTETIVVPDPASAVNGQPRHHLVGPSLPDGMTFSSGTAVRISDRDSATIEERPTELITLEPGDEAAALITLDSVIDPNLVGEYRLSSTLEWRDISLESKESTFRIDPLNIESIHVGLGVRASGHGEGRGAFIHRGTRTSQLFGFGIHENRPGIGEAKVESPVHRLDVGPRATDVTVPWRNSPFFDELVHWVVWREGATVMALSDTSRDPIAVTLPQEPSLLVRPALKVTGGSIEVLAVNGAGTELSLVSFQTEPSDLPRGTTTWSEPLPAPPATMTATLAPVSHWSRRFVAFATQHKLGFEIFLSRFDLHGALEGFRSVRVDRGRLLPGSGLALVVDSTGGALVAALALTGPAGLTCTLVEATFPPGEETPAEPRSRVLGDLPAAPKAGAVFYEAPEGNLERRIAVIELEGEILLTMGDPGGLLPVPDRGEPTTPILIVPGQQTTYVLHFEPERGLHLEPL